MAVRQAGGETLALIRRLRRARYDLAVDLRGNDLCRLLAFLGGARRRLGPTHSLYETPGRPNLHGLLTDPVALPDGPRHAIARSLQVVEAGGEATPYHLPVTPARRSAVRGKLSEWGVGQRFAVLHARPSEESRQWSAERFATVANFLHREYDLDVLLTGTPRDRDYNADIRARAARPERVFNVAGLFARRTCPRCSPMRS